MAGRFLAPNCRAAAMLPATSDTVVTSPVDGLPATLDSMSFGCRMTMQQLCKYARTNFTDLAISSIFKGP